MPLFSKFSQKQSSSPAQNPPPPLPAETQTPSSSSKRSSATVETSAPRLLVNDVEQELSPVTPPPGAPLQQQTTATTSTLRRSNSDNNLIYDRHGRPFTRDSVTTSPPAPEPLDLPGPSGQSHAEEDEYKVVDSPTVIRNPINGDTHPNSSLTGDTPDVPPSYGALTPNNTLHSKTRSESSAGQEKRKSWRRGSASKRKQSGLAGAIAASGLSLANPGLQSPPIPPPGTSIPRTNTSGAMPLSSSPYGRAVRASSSRVPSDQDDSEGSLMGNSDEEDAIFGSDQIPVTGFAVASSKRNQDFHELFPSCPEGDYLIEDYGCALHREILIQGRLYISENHICFHANIFGWITNLVVPIAEITALEKKATALVIPNAIAITTRTSKYHFASFLSRDTAHDVMYNLWRVARPEGAENGRTSLESASASGTGHDQLVVKPAPPTSQAKVTQCACSLDGSHYPEVALDTVFPGTPEKIYNLMFASGFVKDFMRDVEKLTDIQISDWTPSSPGFNLLTRNMSYIKPLNGSVGPKQTKCELRDETLHLDYNDYISMLTTTRTPDVPSGGAFSVKTRTCLSWQGHSTKIVVTTTIEWTGRSFIKGIINASALDGQRTYHASLEKAMRAYIAEHRSEFVPEGGEEEEDVAPPDAEMTATGKGATRLTEDEVRKAREKERNLRGMQWAWDTFDGASKVAVKSTRGAIELLRDLWESSSQQAVMVFLIVLLIFSNIYTYILAGRQQEIGRHKEAQRIAEREKWVRGIVTGLLEKEMVVSGRPAPPASQGPLSTNHPSDLGIEIADMTRNIDDLEARIARLKKGLDSLD